MKNFFTTKLFKPKDIQEKSISPYASLLYGGYYGNLFDFATTNIQWMQYYTTVAPVGDAVDKIAEKGSVIPLLLFAPDNEEAELPINNHPFLKLLKKPNPYQTQQNFIKEALVHERATGNNYLYLTGGISANQDRIIGEPVEMYNLRPDFMTVTPDTYDGRPAYYQCTLASGKLLTFNRREVRNINGKMIDTYIEQNGYGQLYHFKNISARRAGGYYILFGDAPLQSAEIQIGQYFEAAVYNYFLIKNGLSAKNMISPDLKDPISQDQLNKLRAFIQTEFTGSGNSGKTIVSTMPLKSTSLAISLKDMDFKDLDRRTSEAVYRKLEIPLPLVGAEHTAMNNMETSYLMFYDNAVLPTVDNLCNNLFTFPFTDRYKDSQDFLKLGYTDSSIGALQPRIAQNIKLLRESGVATINELREYQGLSRVESEGCDDIWINKNQIPIGKDTNLIDTIGVDQQRKKYLEKKLRAQKNQDGTAFYSEDEIKMALKDAPMPIVQQLWKG